MTKYWNIAWEMIKEVYFLTETLLLYSTTKKMMKREENPAQYQYTKLERSSHGGSQEWLKGKRHLSGLQRIWPITICKNQQRRKILINTIFCFEN